MKTYKLTDLVLDEVSGVDTPANQHAGVVLAKRFAYNDGVKPKFEGVAKEGDGSVTVEELTKKLEALQAQVTDLTKKADVETTAREAAEAANAALTKSAEEAGLAVEDGKIVKRAEPEYIEIDGEKVEKALVPALVLKALEKAARDNETLNKRNEEVELAKRGETELPNLVGTALAKGRLLKSLEGEAELLAALKAADEVMKANYEEKGDGKKDDKMSEPDAKLDRMAKEYAASKSVPYETAYNEVTKSGEGYDLLREMRSTAN